MYNSEFVDKINIKNATGWKENCEKLAAWAQQYLIVRNDCQGRYGENGPYCKKEELTEGELHKHFRLEQTLGAYSTRPDDDMVRWGCLDVDNHDGSSDNWQHVCELMRRSRELGIVPLAETSGEHSWHLWYLWSEYIPASTCKQFLSWLIRDIDRKDMSPIEVYPKQDSIKGKFGNFVRIPGRHHRRNTVSTFWDGKIHYLGEQAVKYLLAFEPISPALIPDDSKNFIKAVHNNSPVITRIDRLDAEQWWKDVNGDLRTLRLADLFEERNLLIQNEGEGKHVVVCPWSQQHTTESKGTAIWLSQDKFPNFNCLHSHCAGKGLRDVIEYFGTETIESYCEPFSHRGTVLSDFPDILSLPVQEIVVKEKPAIEPVIEPVVIEAKNVIVDPRTEYLYRGYHAMRQNVTDEDRARRSKSVLEAYELIPATGFLADYLAAYLPTTDVSPRLLLGSALSCAASILGRNVWLKNGGRTITPCLWTALIADSGERKSTAVNITKSILNGDVELAKRVCGGDTTWAAMANKLGVACDPDEHGEWDFARARRQCEEQEQFDKGVSTLALDEIGGWLKKLDMPYNSGLKETLTGAYEGFEFLQKETAEKAYHIHKPCINLLGASTPTWLAANVTQSDIEGGFLGRFTFFISQGKDYKLLLCDNPDEAAIARLTLDVMRLKRRKGEFKISPEALESYCQYLKKVVVDERLESWGNRLGNVVFKFAMIFAATEGETMAISKSAMLRSCRLVEVLLVDLNNYIEMKMPTTIEEADSLRVLEVIAKLSQKSPSVQHSASLKKFKKGKTRHDAALKTLMEQRDIIAETVTIDGKKTLYYRLP